MLVQYIVCFCLSVSAVYGNEKKNQILANIFKDYDESTLPNGEEADQAEGDAGDDGNPVIIYVNMYLRRIEINDAEQEMKVQLTFRQFWTDDRLAYESEDKAEKIPPFIVVDQGKPEYKIWKPDTFFPNDVADDSDDSEHANILVRISPKGEVIYSQRFTSTFLCPMNVNEYPFDEPVCTIDVASYGFTSDHVKYVWKKKENLITMKAENAVSLKANLNTSISGYELVNTTTSECTSKTEMGKYSCLRLILTFERTNSLETHKAFGYSISLVLASWVPFWLKPFDTAARAIIGIACLATTIVFNHLVLDETIIENVSYVTPMHVWTDATLGFVFLALAQLALVVFLSPRYLPHNAGVAQEQGEILIKRNRTDESSEKIFSVPFKEYHWGKRLDIVCRVLFPLAYAIFNIVFWSIYSD